MPQILENFSEWMMALSPFWAYVAILLIAYGENVLPPIPGDLVVVFGGYLAGIGQLNFIVVVLLGTIGGALGFMTMYGIGARIGHTILEPGRYRWLPKEGFAKAHAWVEKRGSLVVLGNRFLSGLRSVISLAVGVAGMNPAKATLYCTVSSALWTSLITYAGFALGDNWHFVGAYLSAYGRIVSIVLLVAGILYVGYRVHGTRRKRGG